MESPAQVRPAGAQPLTAGKIKFPAEDPFHRTLKLRVQEYFERAGLSGGGGGRMVFKTAAILLWFAASYGLLVFWAAAWWQALFLSISLALAISGIGFSIQHDANHGAYSKHGAVNRLLGMTLDLLGASSGVWHWKHNVYHHTYTNLSGADADIDLLPFGRLSPAQPRYRLHRFQHLYLWSLYGLLYPKWAFVDDFKDVARARIGDNSFPRPRGRDLAELIGGKLVFLAWALAVPLVFHPWWAVLGFFAATALLVGVTLAVVFQLAHCAEEAKFYPAVPEGGRLPVPWAVHQVETTVNFAPRNPLLTWYLGGLNFQIEHHLFPKVCHVHYPKLSEIVQDVCAQFGVRYSSHPGIFPALRSHWRWLRRMGLPPAQEPAPNQPTL